MVKLIIVLICIVPILLDCYKLIKAYKQIKDRPDNEISKVSIVLPIINKILLSVILFAAMLVANYILIIE